MKLTQNDRKDLVGVALQIFMSFAATVSSAVALLFVLSLVCWFCDVNMLIIFLLMFIGIPALAVNGAITSWRLYRFYNEEQARRCAAMEGIPYNEALMPDHPTRCAMDFMLLVALYGLLQQMMGYESSFPFWLTSGLLTAIFIIGCAVMAKVASTARRWNRERTSGQGLWSQPMLPPHHD